MNAVPLHLQTEVETKRKRLLKVSHQEHESIVRYLQDHPDPLSVPFLEKAIIRKPRLKYLDYDDYGAFYKKCLWALQAIGTPAAIAVIRKCAVSQKPALRSQALYRLSKIEQSRS